LDVSDVFVVCVGYSVDKAVLYVDYFDYSEFPVYFEYLLLFKNLKHPLVN